MHNSRYNGSPALSPIGRNLQHLDNTSMTNLLTPTKSNKSMLSSTRITPQRTSTTPRYALSKPIARSPLTSTQFNSNSTFYTPSKVSKTPPLEQSAPSRVGTPTHQAKYGRAGLFPVVHFFQKKVPVITPKQNSCVIKLAPNSPGLFDDSLDSAYEAQNHVNTSQAAEPTTRSVLDALKEISRKRIHGNEGYEKEKEKTNEYSKRTREEDTSISPKSNATSPQQAPKRICVVDPIYASITSSFCLKNNKRKLYECWLPTNDKKTKKLMSVETQTQATEETKTKSVAVQNECIQVSTSKTGNEANSAASSKESTSIAQTDETDEYENETAVSAQRAWDEKIYAIQKKNKLAIVLSRITGEQPKLIPVPRLWDKTNDITDAAFSGHTTNHAESAKSVTASSATPTLNGPGSIITTKTNESTTCNPAVQFGFTAPGVANTSVAAAPTTTTASIAAPISSPSLSTAPVTTYEANSTPETSKSDASSSSTAPTSSSSSLPSLNFFSDCVTVGEPILKAPEMSSAKSTFAFGSNLPSVSSAALNSTIGGNTVVKPASTTEAAGSGGFTFGTQLGSNDSNKIAETSSRLSASMNQLGASILDGTAKTTSSFKQPSVASVLPFTKTPAPSTANTSSSPSSFTASTLKTSTFTSPNSKPIFGGTAVSSAATTSALAFPSTGAPSFGGSGGGGGGAAASGVNGDMSFATAFGLKSGGGSLATGTPNVSFDTGASAKPAPSAGGFSFKINEPTKGNGESMFGSTTKTATTGATGTATGPVFGSAGGTTGAANTSMFNATASGATPSGIFGAGAQAPVTQPTTTAGFGAPSAKSFGGGFGSTSATTTAPPPSYGASMSNAFGSTTGGSAGFGATTTSTSSAAPGAAFGSGFGMPAQGTPLGGTTQSSGLPSFGALSNQKKAFGGAANTTNSSTTSAGGGFSFGAANNATFGASTTSASSGFGSGTTANSTNGSGTGGGFGFGTPAPTSGGGFGANSTSGFGAAPASTASSAFGAKTAESSVFAFVNNTKPATTSTPAAGFGFNAPSTGTSSTGSTFGQAASGTAGGGGSGGVFSFGTSNAPPATTNPPFAFGGANNTTTTASSFGSSAGFGSSNIFGPSAPAADFSGSTPNVNPFGKSPTSAFGAPASNTAPPPAFGAPASNSGPPPAFGAPASNSGPPPAFGAPASNSGPPPAFGAPASSAAPPPAFGSTMSSSSAFGASAPAVNPPSFATAFGQAPAQSNFNSSFGSAAPAAANSGFPFGASSSTSGFGSANNSTQPPPAFGSNNAMPNNAFNFKAPAAAGASDASKSVFAFGNVEPPKPAAGGFNFSAGTSAPTAQSFGASFGSPAPQQPGMFNIGASSAAPVKRTPLRAKRRT